MRFFGGIVLLILGGCAVTHLPEDPNKTILDKTITINEGVSPMALMTEERNQLVDFGENSDAPEAPDIGIVIGFGPVAPATVPRFRVGAPILLHGAYRANGALLLQCNSEPATAILIILTRRDKPVIESARLVTPTAVIKSPSALSPPTYSEDYRSSVQFKVDLKKFFEIPDERGKYWVMLALGDYVSERLLFEVVED